MHRKNLNSLNVYIYIFYIIFVFIYIYIHFYVATVNLDFLGSQDLSKFRKLIHWSYFALKGPPRFWLLLKDFNQTHVQKLRTPACPGAFKGFCHHIIWRYNQNGNKPNQQSPLNVNQISWYIRVLVSKKGRQFETVQFYYFVLGDLMDPWFFVTWLVMVNMDSEHVGVSRQLVTQHVLFWGWFLCP